MAWLTGWLRRKQITVNGTSAGTQSNYQMSLTVNQTSGTDSPGIVYLGGNTISSPAFADLRFTKSDGSTLLNYWIESITGSSPSQTAKVWIKLAPSPDTIPSSPGTYSFYIYYNNSSASSLSNGPNTFIFYDDFNSNTISDWVQVQGTQYFVAQNQRMEHTTGGNPSPYWGAIVKGSSVVSTPKFVMEYTANTLASGCQRGYGWMIWSDSSHYFGYCSVGGSGCGNATKNAGYSITSNQESYLTASEKKAQVIYDGSRLKTYFDGSLYWDFTVTLNTNNRFGFYEQESGVGSENPAYWDIFRVRNYASPEPTWSTVGSEQHSITLNISSTPTGGEIWLAFPTGSAWADQLVQTNNTIYPTQGTGYYDIMIGKGGYQPYTLYNQYYQEGFTYNIVATLIQQPGSLAISSTPTNAEIYLALQPGTPLDQGITTQSGGTTISNLTPGIYNIKLTLSGYTDWTGTANITSNSTTTVNATFAGSANITSTPSGAEIYLAISPGTPTDQSVVTPKTISNLTSPVSGATTIWNYTLKLSGYADTSSSFTATAGQTINIPVTFPGSLYITSIPTGAQIYIDGILQ